MKRSDRFFDERFPEELSLEAFAVFDPLRYAPSEVALGLQVWQLRALDEYRSLVGLTEFIGELTQAGFAFDALGIALRVLRDQGRHVELCRRMVSALGGELEIPGESSWSPSDRTLPRERRIFRIIVGSLCIGETLSAQALAAASRSSEDPLAKAALTCLAADESIHGRFGWVLLDLIAPHLCPEDRADIELCLPYFIQSAHDAFSQGGQPVSHPFGHIEAAAQQQIYQQTLESKIFPGFTKHGFDAPGLWARHSAATQQRPRRRKSPKRSVRLIAR
jgi:hypothetical protein